VGLICPPRRHVSDHANEEECSMKSRPLFLIAALAVSALISIAGPADANPGAAVLSGPTLASAQKAAKGAGSADQVGQNAADLASGILVPILVVAIGAIALVALTRREVGMAISVVLIGLIAGWFLMAPDSVERVFKGVYERIA
jgi:hypothetical protein